MTVARMVENLAPSAREDRATPPADSRWPARWYEYVVMGVITCAVLAAGVVGALRCWFWQDEIQIIIMESDKSLTNMLSALRSATIMNDPPLYPVFMWFWTRIFGLSEVACRLPSALAIFGACWLTWLTLRRSLSFWASTFGVVGTFCLSDLVIYQNSEARNYGLLLFIAATALFLHARAAVEKTTWKMPLALAATHAALVLCHVFGLFYSVAFTAAIIGNDVRAGRRRYLLYASCFLGWLVLLPWLPYFRNAAIQGNPSWIPTPDLNAFFLSCGQYLPAAFLVLLLVLLAAIGTWQARPPRSGGLGTAAAEPGGAEGDSLIFVASCHKNCDSPHDTAHLLWLAIMLVLLVPALTFAISTLWNSIFLPRYFIPGTLGWAIIVAWLAEWMVVDQQLWHDAGSSHRLAHYVSRGVFWASILVITARPMAYALSLPLLRRPGSDIEGLLPELPIALLNHEDYWPRVYYDRAGRKFFWPTDRECAEKSQDAAEMGYYKSKAGWDRYYPARHVMIETSEFLSRYDLFLMIDTGSPWARLRIFSNPEYEVQTLARNLYAVRRKK